MIIQLLGFVAIIVFVYFTGKTAKENGRNALLWTGACVGVGLALQFVIPVLVVIVITIALIATGTRPDQVESALGWWAFGLNVLFITLSLIGMFLILRHVAQLPEDQESGDVPPPPPMFDQDQ